MFYNNNRYWQKRKYYPVEGNHTQEEEAEINWLAGFWTPYHSHRDYLIKLLKTCRFSSILEIGCGCGSNLYRIKKEFPNVRVAGCDINEDAIRIAIKKFKNEFSPDKFEKKTIDGTSEIDLRVGEVSAIPFNGRSFDIILTDAMLIYVTPDKMARALREIRRVGDGGGKVIMVEYHSKSFLKRLVVRLFSRYNSYDYEKLLAKNYFKGIKLFKITDKVWSDNWVEHGYFILSTI